MDGRGGSGPPADRAAAVDDVAVDALDTLVRLPDVRRVGLALTEGGGRRLRFTASDRDRAETVDWCDIDAYDDVPLTTVLRTGEPVVGALDELDDRYPALVERQREHSVVALAALPLVDAGTPIGGVVLFYGEGQAFDAAQLDDLAGRAAGVARELRRAQTIAPRRETSLADVPAGEGVLVAYTEVECEPRAVGAARRFLLGRLEQWGVDQDVADTSVLCLSELVTNVVLHAGSPAEVRAALDRGALTVTVRDRGASGHWENGDDERPDPLRVHGRGLDLVAGLSARWGSELDTIGATVWFELITDGAGEG